MVATPQLNNALKYFVMTFRDAMLLRPKNVYVLWAELFPSLLVDERTGTPIPERNLKAQASKYARKSRGDLLERLFQPIGKTNLACDTSNVVKRASTVLSQPSTQSQGLMALELEAQFLDAWRFSGCDSARFFEALEENCGLGVLVSGAFREAFVGRMRSDFLGASERDFAEYMRELVHLPHLLNLGKAFGMRACKKVFFDEIAMLLAGALAGPHSYVGTLGYALPETTKTPAMRTRKQAVTTYKNDVQLVPVVALDELGRRVYTQAAPPVRVCCDQTLYMGRDRRWAQRNANCVGLASSFELVSRHHALVRWDAEMGEWLVEDVGSEGCGSTYGTLIVHAAGSREFVRGARAVLRHGDLVCLAPHSQGDEGCFLEAGREDMAYRFELLK